MSTSRKEHGDTPAKAGSLARKLSQAFLSRFARAKSESNAGHEADQHRAEGSDAALEIWKATHGHGGHRPAVPKSLTFQTPPSRSKPKPAPGKRGKPAKVQPRKPSIIIIERAPAPTTAITGVARTTSGHGGHKAAAPHGKSQATPAKPGKPAPKAPSPIVNPFAGWSKQDVKDRIRQLIGDAEIPRFRKAVFETLRRLRDPDTTPEKIMEVMAVDAQLVSKVMQTVNSTAYSPKSRVQSLDHAIMLMGNSDLERIVMLVGAKAALPGQTHPKFGLSDFWKISSRRAVLAREVADLVQPAKANLCFTAGFLQDLSVPLIVSSKKDEYMKIFTTSIEEKRDLHVLEMDSLGWDHSEVGALVAMDWELPDDVTLSVKDQNHPDSMGRPDPTHYVSTLLPSHGEEWNDQFAAQVDQQYVVPRETLDTMCKDSIAKAAELAKLF